MILIRLSLEDDRTIDNINIKFEADTEDEKVFVIVVFVMSL